LAIPKVFHGASAKMANLSAAAPMQSPCQSSQFIVLKKHDKP